MIYEDVFVEKKLPKSLEKQELFEYLIKIQEGDTQARETVIKHNIRLVLYRISKRFTNTHYDLKELVSVGVMGLIKSVDSFNIEKNVEFATYATKCIDNEILMFMRKGEKYLNVASLNQPIVEDKNGKEMTIEDILIDNKLDFVDDYEKQETYKAIRETVEQLPDREKEIITLYYGFINNRQFSQREIAEKLSIAQSYVSRIIAATTNKIGHILEKRGIIESTNRAWKENKKMSKKLKSIYDYFSNYTMEEINAMILKLSDEERELLELRYGNDLENPITSNLWTERHNSKFYGILVPKMKKLLANPEGIIRKPRKDSKSILDIDTIECKSKEEKASNLSESILKSEQVNEELLEKDDYIKILEMIKAPNFDEMLKVLSPKEAIIVCLKLGYIDGKYFSTESISKFLGVESEEVREITKKILLVYKGNLNCFIDQAILIATDKEVICK